MKIKNGEAILGDCLEEMDKLIERGVVFDSIITDVPYGTTACKWDSIIPFEPMWERLNKLIKPNGAIVLFGSEPFSSALRMSNIKNYKYDWVWRKNRYTNFLQAKRQPVRSVENIIVFYKKQPIFNRIPFSDRTYNNRSDKEYKLENSQGKFNTKFDTSEKKIKVARDVLEINTVHPQSKEKIKHETQKPVALIEYLIKTYTNENDLVLDFTAGSFTTAVACENTNRKWICIEKEEEYFNIGIERLG